jgi:type VI secretion system protein VasG
VLSDGEGRVVDFKNTVLFLTSNLASEVITRLCAEEASPPLGKTEAAIKQTSSKHFRPALLARMTVVPFRTLDAGHMKEIVTLKLDQLANRLLENNKMKLIYSADVVDRIADRCTAVDTGARNIDHIMRGSILPRMSHETLARLSKGELLSAVHLGVAGDGSFSFDFSE